MVHPDLRKYLKETINFMSQWPKSLKIEPPHLSKLEHFLRKKKPILIHLKVSIYKNKSDDSIHSVLVIGKKEKKFTILDPLLGRQEVSGHRLLKS